MQFYPGRKVVAPDRLRRHPTAKPGGGMTLNPDHPALVEGRTLFRKSVLFVEETTRVLKSGVNQAKVGGRVVKGPWKGMPIYCLTLEERATCPRSCLRWADCYGNNMHMAQRVHADPDFEIVLWLELESLAELHPGGFVVRLHILGDFYSVAYVDLWRDALRTIPQLHVFGYTARTRFDPIGFEVLELARRHWDRFAIRQSGHDGPRGAITIERGETPAEAIVCPAQRGQTDCCGTCGLCWHSQRTIAFEQHAGSRRGGSVHNHKGPDLLKERPPSDVDRIAEQLEEGLTPHQTAERLGLGKQYVNAMIQRMRKRLGPQAR